jgi:hypothetical protein
MRMTHGASGFRGTAEMEGCAASSEHDAIGPKAGLDGRLRVVKIAQTVFSD